MNSTAFSIENAQRITAPLLKLLSLIVAAVLLFIPVQSSGLVLLFALLALPFIRVNLRVLLTLKWIALATIAFISWAALGWVIAPYDQQIGGRILKFLIGFPFIFVLFNLDVTALNRHLDMFIWLLAGFLICSAFVLIDLAGDYWLSNLILDWKQEGYARNILKPGTSMLVVLGGVLMVTAFMRRRLRMFWLVLLMTLAIIPHESVMHATRMILPVVVISGMIFLWRPKFTSLGLAVLAALVLLILPLMLRASFFEPLVEMGVSFPPSMLHRLVIWDFAGSLLDQHSWTGYGLGSSRFLAGDRIAELTTLPGAFQQNERWIGYVSTMDISVLPLHPHNLGLQIRLETGLIGIVLFLFFVLALVHRITQACSPRELAIIAPVFVMLLMLGNFSFSIWQSWWLAAQALLAAFILHILRERPERP